MTKLILILISAAVAISTAGAQPVTPSPQPAASAQKTETAPQKKPARKTNKKKRKAAASAVDPKQINILLYGAMERLETLSSIYDNLGLRVSTGTLKKAYELDKAVNKAAAGYFKTPEPGPEREGLKTYRGLLETALRSVRVLKEIKDRMLPRETEAAILAVRNLYLAMDEELTAGKLIQVAIEPKPQPARSAPSTGEHLANETETLFAISEVTFALSQYHKENGRFPKRLADLAPKYIPAIPVVSVAGHPETSGIVEIDTKDNDEDYARVFRDTGRWLYFSNKRSRYYGRVFIDCFHKNAQGVEFYKIGERK